MTKPQVIELDPRAVDGLGFGELLEACDLAGVDMTRFREVGGNDRLRLMLAVAFILQRRKDPNLTWRAVQSWSIEVAERAPANPPRPRQRGATNGHSPGPRSRSADPSPRSAR